MKAIVISMIAAGLLVTGSAMAEVAGIEMPEMAKKNNCTPCHQIYRPRVGPSWMDVSRKYKGAAKFTYGGQEYPLLEGLMLKVSKGGAGNWSAMPMPANDQAGTRQADIKELVTFVIGLEKAEAEKMAAKKAETKK